MALIKCPECGKEISDKAESCIYCGYPLNKSNLLYKVIYNGFDNDKTKFSNQVKLIAFIRQILNLDLKSAMQIIDSPTYIIMDSLTKDNANWLSNALRQFSCNIEINQSDSTQENHNYNTLINSYICNGGSYILCPHCGSNQITTGQRGFSLIAGFLGSNKTVNRCSKCGWTWQP